MKYFAPACVENGNQILSHDLDAQGNSPTSATAIRWAYGRCCHRAVARP